MKYHLNIVAIDLKLTVQGRVSLRIPEPGKFSGKMAFSSNAPAGQRETYRVSPEIPEPGNIPEKWHFTGDG